MAFDSSGDDAPSSSLTSPLSSIEIPAGLAGTPTDGDVDAQTLHAADRPLALRDLRLAPVREIPEYVYDPVRQVATDRQGRPLAPQLGKDWTTIAGTHTDGDGGDNEMWDWEETK